MAARFIDIDFNPSNEHIARYMPTVISQLRPPAFEVVQHEGIGDISLRIDGTTISGEDKVIRVLDKLIRNPQESVKNLERV